ncbi:MAG: nitrogenase component 1 [Bilifractor sp.]|jgi:nitrogenase molybdenum-cofactor synthesis protein NifE
MRQAQRVLSTYAVDLFGICSALYELGGLVVMHDASGCNSTYTTHDEPRWYDVPAMIYLSGLREVDTIYGNDRRLIEDVAEVAGETHPRFIAVGGSPLPNAIGTDFRAVAKLIEERTGIPTLGFRTDGIHTYIKGAGDAFLDFGRRFLRSQEESSEYWKRNRGRNGPGNRCRISEETVRVNLLGATPLDFSVTGTVSELKRLIRESGMEVLSSWAMGDSFDTLANSSCADVNLVISSTGFPLARWMQTRFGIPYVIGFPVGEEASDRWIGRIRSAAGKSGNRSFPDTGSGADTGREDGKAHLAGPDQKVLIIGEPVQALSLREAISSEGDDGRVRILCPMRDAPKDLIPDVLVTEDESEIRESCRKADRILCDPIYGRLLPGEREKFIFLPQDAYSGRYYREQLPVFAGPDAVRNILDSQRFYESDPRENKIVVRSDANHGLDGKKRDGA